MRDRERVEHLLHAAPHRVRVGAEVLKDEREIGLGKTSFIDMPVRTYSSFVHGYESMRVVIPARA